MPTVKKLLMCFWQFAPIVFLVGVFYICSGFRSAILGYVGIGLGMAIHISMITLDHADIGFPFNVIIAALLSPVLPIFVPGAAIYRIWKEGD